MLFEKKVFAPIVTNSQICENCIYNGVQITAIKSITLKYDFQQHEVEKLICLTLYDEATSLMGLNVWLTRFCESLHTKHTGCLSSRQKSLSFSLCKLQISSDPDERLSFLCFRNDSHTFFNARLHGGQRFEDLLMQTGHFRVFLVLHNCWRHSYRHCDYMTEEQESWRFHSTRDKKNLLQIVKPFHCLSSSNLLSVQKQIGTCKIKVDMWLRCLCIHQWLNLLTSFSSLLSDKVHSTAV